MKADNINLQGILHSPNRYIIPVFQRYYSWERKEWSQLWENLQELEDPEDEQTHFMGALVFVPDMRSDYTMPTFQVIDGQQRLITLSLLMCALRNTAKANGYTGLAAEINDTFLVHPYKKGEEVYRVFPRQRDRDEFQAIVDHRSYKGERGRLTDGLLYFLKRLETISDEKRASEGTLRHFFAKVANGLEFVYITLDEENPYRIFKSLNSTGMNLSEADLIRNFMLMSVGNDSSEQDKFDDKYWRPLERLFEDDSGVLNSRDFSIFFRDYLMAAGRYIPLSSTFYYFERQYGKPGFKPVPLAKALKEIANLYNVIRGFAAHDSVFINRALHRLRRLNNGGTYPLLLNLLGRVRDKSMSEAEFGQAVELVECFLKQIHTQDEPPRSLSRWFAAACRRLEDRPVENLQAYLIEKGLEPARSKA